MKPAEKIQILRKRLTAFRNQILQGPDFLVVTKEENKYYLSMFSSTSYELVIGREKNFLLTDFRYAEAAGELSELYEVVVTKPGYSIREFLRDLNPRAVGLEFESVTMDYYAKLVNVLPEETEVLPFDGIIEELRSVKDEQELACIAQAEKIGDQAFSYILGEIRPGVTEKEIAWKLERQMRELGAEKLSFETIVVSGERSSLPHGHPGEKTIEKGDCVTMDFGCMYQGYCSDMTRTVAVGRVTEEQKKIYEIVLKAQVETCSAIRAGMKASDVDQVARSIIQAEGYGEFFGHGLGHGVGLEIHEAPTANPRSKEILKPGMLVTVEPGIYLPKKFGVRIEDLSYVTENGIINLTGSEKELMIL